MAELEVLNTRMKSAREMLADQKMDADDFREIKAECQAKMNILESKLESLAPENSNVITRIKSALTTLCKLDEMYDNGSSEQKRFIISSIFPGKLSFDGNAFRTA